VGHLTFSQRTNREPNGRAQTREDGGKREKGKERGRKREEKKRGKILAKWSWNRCSIDLPIRNPYFKQERKQEESPRKKQIRTALFIRADQRDPKERRKPIVRRASRRESFQAGFSFGSNGPRDEAKGTLPGVLVSCVVVRDA